MAYERQTAKKCKIGHLLSGNYVEKEGWTPNYLETSIGNVSRANIIAVVVAKENNSLVLDDGSGRVSLRSFGEVPLMEFEVGEKLIVIGRPRVFNKEIYIAAEIVKKIADDRWLEHRKIEISMLPKVEVKKVIKVEEIESVHPDIGNDILAVIKSFDSGDGADIDEIAKKVKGGERILRTMMEEGDVFEVKPGKIKVLD